MNSTPNIFRWIARILSIALLLFWGYFIAAHLAGGNKPAPRPLSPRDLAILAALLASLAGLAVAWKRERAGGLMTLAAVLLGPWRAVVVMAVVLGVQALTSLSSGALVTSAGWGQLNQLAIPISAVTALASPLFWLRRGPRGNAGGGLH